MVGGVERSFGTSVPFLIILYTKKIKNQGVLRKKSNTRSYFFWNFAAKPNLCRGKPGFLFYLYFIFVWRRRCPDKKRRVNARHGAREEKLFPLTPAWAFDRGFCLGNFIYPLTPAGCPPLPGRRCCSAAFSPGESKKRLPPLREPESGAALKRRNAALIGIRRVLPLVIILLYFLN